MILPDINLLLYAHNEDAQRHEAARTWWDGALSGAELVGVPWLVLVGFIRLTTNRAVFERPWCVDEALERVEAWLAQPNVRVIDPTHRHPALLSGFLRQAGTAGNLTNDAHLAALAVEHGCTIHTTGFRPLPRPRLAQPSDGPGACWSQRDACRTPSLRGPLLTC